MLLKYAYECHNQVESVFQSKSFEFLDLVNEDAIHVSRSLDWWTLRIWKSRLSQVFFYLQTYISRIYFSKNHCDVKLAKLKSAFKCFERAATTRNFFFNAIENRTKPQSVWGETITLWDSQKELLHVSEKSNTTILFIGIINGSFNSTDNDSSNNINILTKSNIKSVSIINKYWTYQPKQNKNTNDGTLTRMKTKIFILILIEIMKIRRRIPIIKT